MKSYDFAGRETYREEHGQRQGHGMKHARRASTAKAREVKGMSENTTQNNNLLGLTAHWTAAARAQAGKEGEEITLCF